MVWVAVVVKVAILNYFISLVLVMKMMAFLGMSK